MTSLITMVSELNQERLPVGVGTLAALIIAVPFEIYQPRGCPHGWNRWEVRAVPESGVHEDTVLGIIENLEN